MAANEVDEARLRVRANELYWTSDESVNQIAEDLDLSKGALYDLVEPHASGLPCPRCGEEMEYPNRTARDKGFLTCPACDLEEDEEEVRARWGAIDADEDAVVIRPGVEESVPSADEDEAARRRIIASAALLGAAAGLALALWTRKR